MKQIIVFSILFGVLGVGALFWWESSSQNSTSSRPSEAKLILSRSFLTDRQRTVPNQSVSVAALYNGPRSDRMGYLLGTLGDGSYSTRSAALRMFDPHLSKDEVQVLEGFIADPNNLKNLSAQEIDAFKNDVMNLLRNQQHPPEDLAATLIKIFSNDQQSEVLRDYALQHLGCWYQDGASKEEQAQIWAALEQGAQGHTGSIPGTSLLAMLRADNLDPEQKSFLQQTALQQIQSPINNNQRDVGSNNQHNAGPDNLTLATALQVCSQLQIEAAYPVALHLAESDQISIPVRISAIAAVGDLGSASDITRLQSWMNGDQPRLAIPARAALQRLTKRLHI